MVTTTSIEANGLTLAVHDWGGTGDPVLLSHATGFHGRIWAPIAERLVASGRHVWSFDFRGHGDSDAPDIEYSWHGFGDDVLAVAQHLDIAGDPALLACGHSKGAAALLLADVKEPATFARVWAYEPIVFPSDAPIAPQPDFPMAAAARKRRNEWASIDEAYDAYASKRPLFVMTEESLRAYVEYGLRDRGDGVFELKCAPEVEARVYSMGPNHGLYTRLGEIDADVLVVCGELSTDIGPPLAEKIVERLRRGRLEVVPGRGHFGPQEDPDAAVASMLAFDAATRA
ncbi:MAG: alpha/beta hydrolase [Actinomycetota bacterium]|nr:alpha/beta hydrolase [Actinomycetota bacterium]